MMSLTNQLKTVAMGLALVASVALILGMGIGESFTVVVNPDNVEATTNTTFGGDVDIVDRITVAGAWITALIGVGALTSSTGNRSLDAIIRTTPIWVGLIGLTQFATDVQSVLNGDMDFASLDDNYAAFIVYVSMSVVAGVLALIGNRR
jgi:hypothetical protein